jgi:two-component system, sensor histidine kinase and response regulator
MEKTAVNPLLNKLQQTFIITDTQFRVIEHKNGNGLQKPLDKMQAEQCSIFRILPDLEQKKGYLEKILSKELSQFEMKSTKLLIDDNVSKQVKVVVMPNEDFADKNGLILLVGETKQSPLPNNTPGLQAHKDGQSPASAPTSSLNTATSSFFQFVTESLPYSIVYRDFENDQVYINNDFEQYFNLPTNTISMADLKAARSKLYDKLVDLENKLKAGENLENHYIKIETTKGRRSFKITQIPRTDENGKLVGILYYGTDATEKLKARKELEEEKSLLQSLMDYIPDTIYFKDIEGRFTRINKAQSEAMGIASPEDAVGKTDFDFWAPEFATAAFQDEQKLLKSGIPLLGKEEKVERSGGWSRWMSASKVPIIDDDGKIIGLVGVSRDITEIHETKEKLKEQNVQLEKARAAAEAAMKERTAFVANMSHEIRTPMNGVIGMTNLMMQTDLNEEQKEYTDIILSSGDTLLHVINDILDFSRIESGTVELEKQPFSLRVCMEECLDLHAATATQKGLELAYYIKNPCPKTVIGDKARLLQVLNNLTSNAIKFTQTGEVILQVSAEELTPGSFILEFKVKDTGIGIAADAQKKLFKPFSQVDSSISRKFGGTGLGLVISKLLVQLMNGKIGFVSKENVGTTFSFTAKAEGRDMKDFDDHSLLASQLAGKMVAIVDDNKTNRRILSLQTKSWGMRPTEFDNAKDVLAAIQSGKRFDLGILDLLMPEMDGVSLAKGMFQDPNSRNLPVILLTSVGWHRESVSGEATNIKQFLTKPIKQSKLFDTIATIFSQKEVEQVHSKDATALNTNVAEKWPLDILLAEDNPVNQKFALRTLQKLGYAADLAENGLEVLKALEKKAYDLILMDIQMPEMDGVETTIIIRSRVAEEVRPQIVALTAHAMPGDREKYLSLGLDDYISKPIKLEELIRVLKSCKPKNGTAINGLSNPAAETENKLVAPEITLTNLKETLGFGEAEEDSFVFELVEVFINETTDLLAQLSSSVKQGDIKTLCRIVHTLKSSSQTIGINNLAELADQIYQNADHYAPSELVSITNQLAAQTESAMTTLKDLYK